MDRYTADVKEWLNRRFRTCDENRIYFAHEPIYGLRMNHSEPDILSRYIRIHRVLDSLSHLRFESLLDVGSAEGYIPFLAHRMLGCKIVCSDLSEEACKRSREIFKLESVATDIHELPFKSDCFDVVLCTETLEHVARPQKALTELLRVAKLAVILTVPNETQESVDTDIREETPHGHINKFDWSSFQCVREMGYIVRQIGIVSPFLINARTLVEARNSPASEKNDNTIRKPLVRDACDVVAPLLRKAFDRKSLALLMALDGRVCRLTQKANGFLVVALKDETCWSTKARKIKATDIIAVTVPYHRLQPL